MWIVTGESVEIKKELVTRASTFKNYAHQFVAQNTHLHS